MSLLMFGLNDWVQTPLFPFDAVLTTRSDTRPPSFACVPSLTPHPVSLRDLACLFSKDTVRCV